MTEWESADGANNRDKVNRARQAAEELFKPMERTLSGLPAAPDSGSNGQQPPRQPRVFALPPRTAPTAKAEPPAETKPVRRQKVPRRAASPIPTSQLGRVRALANYGMTRAEVAELYGVPIEEIDRILKGAA